MKLETSTSQTPLVQFVIEDVRPERPNHLRTVRRSGRLVAARRL
jgi:hypothetical protein